VPNPDLRTILRGTWLAMSAGLPQAIQFVTTNGFTSPSAKAAGLSQVAVWQLMSGNTAAAIKSAAAARQLDPRPVSLGAAAGLVANGALSAEQWRNEVNASGFGGDAHERQALLGYGFFLNRHFAEAALVWKEILDASGNTDLHARAMLASSLFQRGDQAAARAIVVEPFVPDFGDLYAAVSFNEMRRVLKMR
jgi:hypothetical protein